MTPPKKMALGRGLDALISTDFVKTQGSSSINEVPLSQIHANPDQPRRDFDQESLEELAESLREIGIIQPITLRKMAEGDYQIIAGERRFRAAGIAGLKTIPAYIRTADDENVMAMALIENIQREDLNSMEVALACQNLLEVYNMTQEQLSSRIGKKRATVANYLRLLKLPAEIQVGIKDRLIEMGHARAILGTPSPERQLALYQRILRDGLSVRKVEALAQEDRLGKNPQTKREVNQYVALGKELSLNSGLKIKIQNNKVVISFEDEDELRRIIERIS